MSKLESGITYFARTRVTKIAIHFRTRTFASATRQAAVDHAVALIFPRCGKKTPGIKISL